MNINYVLLKQVVNFERNYKKWKIRMNSIDIFVDHDTSIIQVSDA